MRHIAFCAALLLFAACSSSPTGLSLDMTQFEPLPELHAIDFSALQTPGAWDYWELRFSIDQSPTDSLVARGGPVAREALSATATSKLAAASADIGFGISCMPGLCFYYIVAVRGDDVSTIATVDQLRNFLGTIDSAAEAALLVRAYDFWWQDMNPATGYRELATGGWEFVAIQLARDCMPVQFDRVLVHVTREGGVSVRGREVWERIPNACV